MKKGTFRPTMQLLPFLRTIRGRARVLERSDRRLIRKVFADARKLQLELRARPSLLDAVKRVEDVAADLRCANCKQLIDASDLRPICGTCREMGAT